MNDDIRHGINLIAAADYVRDNSVPLAQARANLEYMEQHRKSLKALLMKEAEANGINSAVAQEREAYAHPKYLEHIEALAEAVRVEAHLSFLREAAKVRIDVWRSLEASERAERSAL